MKPGLLVASPRLDQSVFARTVILMCDYSDEGAMGLVINRGLAISIGEVMDQLDIDRAQEGFQQSVLWGGPVEPAAGLVLYEGADGEEVEGRLACVQGTNLCVSASRLILEAIAEGRWKGTYQLCLGYSGWAPGQLDREIAEGSWLVTDFDEALLKVPLSDRWTHTVDGLGVGGAMMWIPPVEE